MPKSKKKESLYNIHSEASMLLFNLPSLNSDIGLSAPAPAPVPAPATAASNHVTPILPLPPDMERPFLRRKSSLCQAQLFSDRKADALPRERKQPGISADSAEDIKPIKTSVKAKRASDLASKASKQTASSKQTANSGTSSKPSSRTESRWTGLIRQPGVVTNDWEADAIHTDVDSIYSRQKELGSMAAYLMVRKGLDNRRNHDRRVLKAQATDTTIRRCMWEFFEYYSKTYNKKDEHLHPTFSLRLEMREFLEKRGLETHHLDRADSYMNRLLYEFNVKTDDEIMSRSSRPVKSSVVSGISGVFDDDSKKQTKAAIFAISDEEEEEESKRKFSSRKSSSRETSVQLNSQRGSRPGSRSGSQSRSRTGSLSGSPSLVPSTNSRRATEDLMKRIYKFNRNRPTHWNTERYMKPYFGKNKRLNMQQSTTKFVKENTHTLGEGRFEIAREDVNRFLREQKSIYLRAYPTMDHRSGKKRTSIWA